MRWNLLKNSLPETNSEVTKDLRYFLCNGAVLFDSEDKYPIWKEEHRAELEKKIVDHYYMRQIGFETFGRFKHELNTRMREIMPYYVEMWKTTQFKYNPIENYNMTEKFTEDGTSSGSSSASSMNKYNDTPMSEVKDLQAHLSKNVTNVTQDDSEANSEGKHHQVNTGTRTGNIGVTTTQQMIQQERDIILNLDKLIIDELQDLFLGVF